MSASRISERQRSFKKGIDADATRRRRDGATVQIRKSIKEDRLNQRRRMSASVSEHLAFFPSVERRQLTTCVVPGGSPRAR